MTIGEHLDDLRGCLMRSMLAFVIAGLICVWPAKFLLELIARPVMMTLRKYGQPDSFLATGPVETLLMYIKVVIFAALVISAPYIIHQIWSFVAVGLYDRERRWVRKLVPASIGLFFAGVVFMYLFALPLALKFLIGFSTWLPQPDIHPTFMESVMLGLEEQQAPETQPAILEAPVVPLFEEDPNQPPVGAVWFNLIDQKLKLHSTDGFYSIQLRRDDRHSMVTTHFRIGEYLTFVVVLTIAFGVAFQMPLVVIFLVRAGLVSIETLRRYRKIVILIIVIIAAVVAPADLMSHVLLAGVMIALYEIGLLIASRHTEPKSEEPA